MQANQQDIPPTDPASDLAEPWPWPVNDAIDANGLFEIAFLYRNFRQLDEKDPMDKALFRHKTLCAISCLRRSDVRRGFAPFDHPGAKKMVEEVERRLSTAKGRATIRRCWGLDVVKDLGRVLCFELADHPRKGVLFPRYYVPLAAEAWVDELISQTRLAEQGKHMFASALPQPEPKRSPQRGSLEVKPSGRNEKRQKMLGKSVSPRRTKADLKHLWQDEEVQKLINDHIERGIPPRTSKLISRIRKCAHGLEMNPPKDQVIRNYVTRRKKFAEMNRTDAARGARPKTEGY